MTQHRGPKRDQVIYSRLETDTEMLERAGAVADHRVYAGCCSATIYTSSVDDMAGRHGVTRRIVEVVPP